MNNMLSEIKKEESAVNIQTYWVIGVIPHPGTTSRRRGIDQRCLDCEFVTR